VTGRHDTTLLVATTNEGKLREIRELLAGAGVRLLTLADIAPVEPPEETGTTFEENARLKATFYAGHSGLTTVAEDSGLAIDALDGAPGVYSARYGGDDSTYPEKFALIEAALTKVPERPRTARFVCALALASPTAVLLETRGTVEGEIAREARGDGGFGYDPIFFYPPFNSTLAEAGPRKSEVSHRARAFAALAEFLRQRDQDQGV
jgi:XTP/dITP diphosphohydrolase